METATLFDADVFLNLDMSVPLTESIRNPDFSELFDDFKHEDLQFPNEEELMNGLTFGNADDGFLLDLTTGMGTEGFTQENDIIAKQEPTIAEEIEKYQNFSIEGDSEMFGALDEVCTPLTCEGSDSSTSSGVSPAAKEEQNVPLSPVSVIAQPTRRRQQTTKPKLFACHLCTSTFTARFNLNKHIRTVHENLRPFHCDVCGASFQQKCHLKQHKTTVHEHKRPYKCEICSLSFGWPAVLNKHIRLKHEKQRPFSCTLCDRTFQQKTHLTQHLIALHEKKKPFNCEQCSLTFNRKERLKKHLQATHDIVEA